MLRAFFLIYTLYLCHLYSRGRGRLSRFPALPLQFKLRLATAAFFFLALSADLITTIFRNTVYSYGVGISAAGEAADALDVIYHISFWGGLTTLLLAASNR